MDKEYIKSLIQEVLNKEFTSTERRRINEYPDRLNMCCVVCGDSKDDRKKRGNLYFDTLKYVCYNDGCSANLDSMCKKYNVSIDPTKKMEMIEHLNSNITYEVYENSLLEAKFDDLLDINDLANAFKIYDYNITDLTIITPGGYVDSYLSERGIIGDLQKNIWQAKYWTSETRYENVLCLMNKGGDKILSMQVRNLKDGKNRMFKIFNYESLYKWIHNIDEVIDIDMEKLTLYNKLGYYFNIMNVDFTETVTIFEGYLDSLFYPNSMGVVGTNTDMRFLESNNLPLQYLYDNDYAGFKKSEEKLKGGFKVFLWQKLFDDIISKKRQSDPYQLMYRIKKVKDLNALAVLVNNPYRTLCLNTFFSNDVFDMSYIPKKKFVKRTDYSNIPISKKYQ